MVAPFPIVDAHQHFWDPRINYYPWLCDQPPIPFRYGDYSALRRPYLPADYFADAARHQVAKTVYVETEWDPRDPIGEMRYVEKLRRETDFPTVARPNRGSRTTRGAGSSITFGACACGAWRSKYSRYSCA